MLYLLPHLVDRAAERDPERQAFKVPRRALSYAELARRSNQLARLLRREGVQRGDRVGIFMPRELRSAVAVYGITKAGAAFVPIDPHVPAGGLRRLIDDCGIRVLVTARQQRKTLAKLAASRRSEGGALDLETLIGLDAAELEPQTADPEPLRTLPWSAVDEEDPDSPPDVFMMEGDLAYLMYSSGSTGRPKGIVHTHRSGMAYARLSKHAYGVHAEDRIGNHSPLHFDMSTFGYFTAPLAGATTVLIPEAHTKLTASLSQLMEDERLTIWYSVPLALIQLRARGVLKSRDLTSLRWVLFGGEPFARQHLAALMARWPQARFSNVYGPAEVNQCTHYHVPPIERGSADASPVPIGRVWRNTEGLVLDAEDQEIDGAGEAGELVIRSPTMMRGYWARPELDAKAFYRRRAAGFEQVFYRTGDLVRRQDDGELLFLGRMDRQVKVRGYRLELDEIERTLMSHDSVLEAGVVPMRDGGEASEVTGLYAGVRARPEAPELDLETLRAFLAEVLSWYAVPKNLEQLEDFPRTTSGKIDRRALQLRAEGAVSS